MEVVEGDHVAPAVLVHHGDEWIELDLPVEFAHSLGFLSDADFQAVLQSFSEFTSQQLRAANFSPMELQGIGIGVGIERGMILAILHLVFDVIKTLGILRNQLAYLLWRRAVLIKLRSLPPIQGN